MPTLLDYEIQRISLSPQLRTIEIPLDWEIEKISPSPQLLISGGHEGVRYEWVFTLRLPIYQLSLYMQ